jgi:16S rRNA (cytosine1402-N4)-methyltransferase
MKRRGDIMTNQNKNKTEKRLTETEKLLTEHPIIEKEKPLIEHSMKGHPTDTQELPHKRRVRYKGTHPKTYKEKYKERQPEKYADTIEKVIQKGSTPAGMHISICVNEILEFLQIKPGQKGLDATLGYGGHTREMLKCLESKGHMYALDVDPIEIVKTRERLLNLGFGPEILTIKQLNFANIDEIVKEAGLFDFVLADLGVSSMQIDNPDRGFSFKTEGPLDLRLNPEKGISAAERLSAISQTELQGMLIENSDEPYAEEISRAIVNEIKRGNKIDTTSKLRDLISKVLVFIPEKERKEAIKKTCQRTFQALRIDVNNEYEVLYSFLEKLPNVLAKGGRVAILTFHSGEDRLVKKSFKNLQREGIYSEVSEEVIRPSAEECNRNPRARSTKMRWAIKA